MALSALATALLVAWLPAVPEARAAGLLWIGFAAVRALRRLRPGKRLRVDYGGSIQVDAVAGAVRKGSFVAPGFTVVRWRPEGAWRDRSLLVAPGMLGAEDSRRLRVLLRWG